MPYKTGEMVICQIENYSTFTGLLVNPDLIVVSIEDPNGSVMITEEVPTNDSTGKYHYNYEISDAAAKGMYKITWKAKKNFITTKTTDTFEVVS